MVLSSAIVCNHDRRIADSFYSGSFQDYRRSAPVTFIWEPPAPGLIQSISFVSNSPAFETDNIFNQKEPFLGNKLTSPRDPQQAKNIDWRSTKLASKYRLNVVSLFLARPCYQNSSTKYHANVLL